jgi:glycosyltransferase involved in cell wall biosynthesis
MNKVSIVMNCYNGEKYLQEALSSIISQTYQNWELIFYDNQSTDQSKKIFESFKDRRFFYHYAEKHTKLFKARNKALKVTTGDLIAFLDVDDYWSETKLEKQCDKFKDNENLDFVFSKYSIVDEFSHKIKTKQKDDLNKKSIEELIINYQVGLSTVMFRKNLMQRINFLFDENYNIIGDFDAFANLIEKVNFLYMDQELSFYRWHNSNLSTLNHSQEINELENWIKKRKNEVSKKILKHVQNKIYYMRCIDVIKNDTFLNSLKKVIFYKGSEKQIKLFMYLLYFNLKKIKGNI